MKRSIAAVIALTAVLAGAARAGDITVTTFVNYGSAYRDAAWAPIDVVVDNQDRDIEEGSVEVRFYDAGGELVSPVHRVPLDSAKGSKKRLRVVAYLEGVDRMDVQLWQKRRPLPQLPLTVKLTPIKGDDYLSLVLDDEPGDYGFLSAAALTDGSGRRSYRENLRDETLPALADHPACFRAFNAVILGDIDPTRISERHREVLTRFVADGGVLAVMLGSNTSKYRNSWVMELAGVRITGDEIVTESDLLRRAFGAGLAGAGSARQGVVAKLEAADPEVKTVGRDLVVAARRKVGRGYVAVFAPDAAGRLLQDNAEYRALWRDVYGFKGRFRGLDAAAAASVCQARLPELTGVRIQPRSSVFIYLGTYFLVAILGNWLFWNRLKRREMAWLCLIGFSFAFTAYAMIFGTVGRAKSTEIDRVDALHVPAGGGLADLHSFLGVLTARTSRFTARITSETALVSDVTISESGGFAAMNMGPSYGLYEGGKSLEPFQLVADSPPRLEDFLVRASEMRVLRLQSTAPVPDGITGSLVLDQDGLHGELENHSTNQAEKLWLLFQGHIHGLVQNNGTITVEISPRDLERGHQDGLFRNQEGQTAIQFQHDFIWQLFSESGLPPGYNAYANVPDRVLSETAGPFVFGWLDPKSTAGMELAGVELNKQAEQKKDWLLAVYDVPIEFRGLDAEAWRDLAVKVSGADQGGQNSACGSWAKDLPPAAGDWTEAACMLYAQGEADVEFYVPEHLRSDPAAEFIIELYAAGPALTGTFLSFAPAGVDARDQWGLERLAGAASLRADSIPGQRLRFTLPDWSSRLDARAGVIAGKIYSASYSIPEGWAAAEAPMPAGDGSDYSYFTVIARVKTSGPISLEKEWPSWQ